MKKIFLIINLFFVFIIAVKAQFVKGGIISGFNITQVDGDEYAGYKKFGLHVGGTAIIPLKNNFSLGLELLYNEKGSYEKPLGSLDTLEYTLRLNYAEVPIMIRYIDKDLAGLGLGFSYGRLVNAKEWENGIRSQWSTPTGPYKTEDYSVIAEAFFKVYGGLKANIRYSYSMYRLRTREFYTGTNSAETRHQYNNSITFRLMYIFKDASNKKGVKE